MKVVITGGAGFLGQRVAEAILQAGSLGLPDGESLDNPEIVLADRAGEGIASTLSSAVTFAPLDVGDAASVQDVIGDDTAAVFHLAAVVSAAAEADFDLGMRVNLEGTRNVLDACRALARPIPLVSTSSLAVFGGALPARLGDAQAVQPENSYGAQKAVGEILCGDYRRKGFCDARTLRLPTVVIRPGKPNAAASSFASSILREPLRGEGTVSPVARDLRLWIASPEAAVRGMLHAMSVPAADWPAFGTLNLPGLSTSVDDMLEALERKAGRDAVDLIRFEPDERIGAIVGSWPYAFDTGTAQALGFTADTSLEAMIDSYLARYMNADN